MSQPVEPRKSRGAIGNPKPRFDQQETVPFDDGWDSREDEVGSDPRTEIRLEPAKSIITRNESPDLGFDRSINPYRGCEHGCVYCFARPTHAYLGLSPGLDFETKIIARPNAAQLLERELRRPGYQCRTIAVGTNTDPYQPAENRLRIMRECLKVMAAFRQPVSITTKGFLVTRDIDLLAPMAAEHMTAVGVSVTTLDRDLSRKLEPRTALPERRLQAIRLLASAGVPVTLMAAPMIPFINDHELERIMAAGRDAGATAAAYVLLRLPHEVKDLFAEWLEARYPAKAAHVLSLIRQQREGRLNDPNFGSRFRGSGEFASLLARRFTMARRKLGFAGYPPLDASRFRPPPQAGDQMRLL